MAKRKRPKNWSRLATEAGTPEAFIYYTRKAQKTGGMVFTSDMFIQLCGVDSGPSGAPAMTVYRDTGDIAHVMMWDEDSKVWHSLCGDPCVTVSDERDYDLIMLNGAPLSEWCGWCQRSPYVITAELP